MYQLDELYRAVRYAVFNRQGFEVAGSIFSYADAKELMLELQDIVSDEAVYD